MMKRMLTALLIAAVMLSVCGTAFAVDYPGVVLRKDMKVSESRADEIEEAITYMQERLDYYEFYTGDIDGKFGSAMFKAVAAFQKKNNLKYDGKIGQATWDALDADDSRKKSDEDFVVIKRGMKGDAVTEIQLALRATYYYGGTITKIFDAATERAVKSFQESTGYTADGKVGETTYDGLINGTASIFETDAIPRRTLSSGMRGYDVAILQAKLVSLNYLTTLASSNIGYYGVSTAAAVRKFQAANKIEETGKANAETRRYLWPSATDNKQVEEDAKKDTEYDTYQRPTLRKGSYGSYVALAQMRLKAGGFLLGAVDRVFGVDTVNAVYKLQKRYGLKADGVIGPETWEVIMQLNVENAEQEIVDPDKESVGGVTKTLRYGDKGVEVKKLQQDLMSISLDGKTPLLPAGSDDGIFGRKTRTAVRALQKAYKDLYKIKVDGIVGPDTYVALNEALGRQFK